MRMRALMVAVAAAGLLAAGGAEAMPAAGLAMEAAPPVTLVRGGCGFGEHRGFFGGCRINHGWRGRIRAYRTGLPLGCPPGRRRIRGICRFVY